MRYLWQLFDALYNFFIKGTLTSESLWVAAFFTTSVEKELFYVKFHAKLTIHFGNIKSWYNYNTTMFAKYTLTNQMVLYKLKLELFEKKIHKGILHFSKCTVFLIWLWLKLYLFVNWFYIIISIQVLVLQGSLTKNMVAWLRYLGHVSVAKVSFREFFCVYKIFFTNFDLDHNFPCLNLSKNLLFSFAVQ